MVILIGGASHTGKTALAQKLLQKHGCPYLSIDHLKMGLIRSGMTRLTPESPDEELTKLLWPILCGIIKTAIENRQNLVVEGCYIPYNWKESFEDEYLRDIRYIALVMSDRYIESHFEDIKAYANVIEQRLTEDISAEELIRDNVEVLRGCKEYGLRYLLIDGEYPQDIEVF